MGSMKPRIVIGQVIAMEMAHTDTIFRVTMALDLLRTERGEHMARNRSREMVQRWRMDDVHMRTSNVTYMSQMM